MENFANGIPPRFQEVQIYFSQRGIIGLEATHFFLYYELKKWEGRNGIPIRSWKTAANNWIYGIRCSLPYLCSHQQN